MISECIILAGGQGTRLRKAVPNLPKCMAPVAGRPFLAWVLDYLREQGIQHFIFSLGYRHQDVTDWVRTHYSSLSVYFSVEKEPLGTGGAIRLACTHATTSQVLVVNGDTLFRVNVPELAAFHEQHQAHCTLCLKPMQRFNRYGVVELNPGDGSIQSFREKQYYESGLINGGVYALNVPAFLQESLPEKFSFEKDYLEKYYNSRPLSGLVQDEYFIDIGIPEDYAKANEELGICPMINLQQINPAWTLFLDRDGVINHEKRDDYVYNYNEFIFYDGVPEALAYLAERFGKIIVVTNQRGIGRGLMTEADLNRIHAQMLQHIKDAGGRIDAVYHCPAVDDADPDRKPNPGMFFRAHKQFPSIEPKRSIIVGNNLSDMEFGRNAGLYTVFVKTTHPDVNIPNPAIDAAFASLPDFAKALRQP